MDNLENSDPTVRLWRESARRRRRNFWRVAVFVGPWVIGFLLFSGVPMLLSLYYSFTAYDLGTAPHFIGTANWSAMLKDPLMWKSLWNAVYYTFVSVPLQLMVALSIALLLNRKKVWMRGVFRTIFYLPTVVPTVAASVLWVAILDPYGGPINKLLGFLHLPQPLWLQSTTWAMPGIILMSLWSIGTMMIIYLAGLNDIPAQLYEASRIDGAVGWNQFRYITMPMLSPVILFNGIIALIGAMQTFTQAFVMTKGGPENATLFFSIYLYQNAFEYFNMGYASAMAWFLFLIILLMIMASLLLSRRSVTYDL